MSFLFVFIAIYDLHLVYWMPYLLKDSKLDHILYICFTYYHSENFVKSARYMFLSKFYFIIENIELISIPIHTNGNSRKTAVEM